MRMSDRLPAEPRTRTPAFQRELACANPSTVITGLDPGIHALGSGVDGRDVPGHVGEKRTVTDHFHSAACRVRSLSIS